MMVVKTVEIYPDGVRRIRSHRSDKDDMRLLERTSRPKTRGECKDGQRPCPWIGCKYHLYLKKISIDSLGRAVLLKTFHSIGINDMKHTCALDIADQGPQTLEYVGNVIGVTRERVRQIEEIALAKLARVLSIEDVREMIRDMDEIREKGWW